MARSRSGLLALALAMLLLSGEIAPLRSLIILFLVAGAMLALTQRTGGDRSP